MSRYIHVAVQGDDRNTGDERNPYRTISKAASEAVEGDTVIVHAGTYREAVVPRRGGSSDRRRIVYTTATGEKVRISGAEIVQGWEHLSGSVWKKTIPNSFFGSYNPFATRLYGDWFQYPDEYELHTGDLFLNGKSLYEARSIEDVADPQKRVSGPGPSFSRKTEYLRDPEFSVYVWRAETDERQTTIYANFQEYDPNEETVEISVRPFCFFPERSGIDYISVNGFELCQCAGNWNPPTAFQGGIIGPCWSKGWIIENCDIHDGKTSGISLGRDSSTGANLSTRTGRKSGYQYQLETIFKVRRDGWDKDHVGSHIIRNNRIHHCGENGIVGNLGCIFSKIHDNDIHDIAVKHEFFGAEIAGIKLHSPIDVEICRNRISHCTLGTWLDWQLQGARISSNLYAHNDRDIFLEVSHGPYVVDNNIFGSSYNVDNASQGGAFVHNLFAGAFRRIPTKDRATPYHFPHSTDVAGYAFVYSGDDRFFNNIFLGGSEIYPVGGYFGTADYDGHIPSFEAYIDLIKRDKRDHSKFWDIRQPVYIDHNLYLSGAKPYGEEKERLVIDGECAFSITEEDGRTYLHLTIPGNRKIDGCELLDSSAFQTPRITECPFEDGEGNPILFDKDFLGNKRGERCTYGPLEGMRGGENSILVWDSAE